MYCYKLTAVTVITVLSLWGQVRSQDDGFPRRVTVNGPTGFSVEAEARSQGPHRFIVNGPTSFSVEAEEHRINGAAEGFEEVDVDIGARNEDGSPRYVETDVDLDNLDNDRDTKHFINGHSGSSAHSQQVQALAQGAGRGVSSTHPKENQKEIKLSKGLHIYTTDWSTDASEWSFKGGEWALVSLPEADHHPNLPAPLVPSPALVVVTKDPLNKVNAFWSVKGLKNMTLHFSYFLSEGESPHGIPELNVYQVKDDQNHKLVSSLDSYGQWSDSTTELPYSGSSKIVFVGRLSKLGNEIAIDDITISGVSDGPTEGSKARMNLEKKAGATGEEGGNTSMPKNAAEVPSTTEGVIEVTERPGAKEEGTVTPGEVVEGNGEPQETGNVTEKTEEEAAETTGKTQEITGESESEKGTENPAENGQVTENPEETELTTLNSNITMQGNDTHVIVNGSSVSEHGNETYSTVIPEFTDYPNEVNETVIPEITENPLQGNDTLDHTEDPESSSASLQGEVTATGNETEVTEYVIDNSTMTSVVNGTLINSTEEPQANQTTLINVTMDVALTGEGNDTESFVTTLSSNLTENVNYNVTNNLTNAPIDTTLDPGTVYTEPSVLINQTGPVVTTIIANLTEPPVNNATGEGNRTTNLYVTTAQTTSDISSNAPVIATSDQGLTNSTATTISLIMTNSTSPSGANGTLTGLAGANGNGTDSSGGGGSDGGSSSWSAFKVFLVVCLLGVVVMGFLYWRRQRRRDDEIPVFSRASSADYHNPTFTDDDANFASRGTGHNYKSFE